MASKMALAGAAILICGTCVAQNADVFPLAVGNSWVYYHSDSYFNDNRYMSMNVVDSVKEPDGYVYFVLDSPGVSWVLGSAIRSDSNGLYEWNATTQSCDTLMLYNVPSGTRWGRGYLISRQDSLKPSFPYGTRSWHFSEFPCSCEAWMSEGVGVTHMVAIGPDISQDLEGGIISGRKWGVLGVDAAAATPVSVELEQNFPEPFTVSSTIAFRTRSSAIAHETFVLALYDIYGRIVRTLYRGVGDGARHAVQISAEGLPVGCYVYVLHSSSETVRKFCTIVR